MLTAVIACAVAAALAFAGAFAAVCLGAPKGGARGRADCIIVPGAHVWMDGRMSDSLLYRCRAALAAWRDGVAPVMILCGARGHDEPVTEAAAMRGWMLAQGVPEGALLTDEASVNTAQNLANAKAIMAANGLRAAAVCTSDYHLRRALWIARDVGIEVTGIAAPSPKRPDVWLRGRLRETCSWALYFLRKIAG